MTSKLISAQDMGDILLYQTEDGLARIEVRVVEDTIWLSFNQLAALFQREMSWIILIALFSFYLEFAELQA